jgi:hypothetical protein
MSDEAESPDSGVDSALASPEIMTKTTPRPKKKQKGKSNLPISIGKEHQNIIAAVQAALTAVKEFKKCKTGSDVNLQKCVSFATDTLPSFRVETIEFDTWEDYVSR